MKYLIALLAPLVSLLLLPGTAMAAGQDEPDSVPTVESIEVYRHLLETGDQLYRIYENTPYSTLPDYTFDEAFIWQLLDTDNVTVLGSAVGYPYNSDGYGYNVISLYFPVATAPTWGQAYPLRLCGTPAAFDSPPQYNYQVETSDYTTSSNRTDVREELRLDVISIAQDLDNKWALGSAYSLLTEQETGTVLSTYGESFFRGAIYGLQSLCPDLFSVVIRDVEIEDRTWTDAYSSDLADQYAGTWVQDSIDAGGTLFGVDYNIIGVIIVFCACFALVAANMYLLAGVWGGLTDATLPLIVGAGLGFYDLAFLGLLAAIAVLYTGFVLWGIKR